MCQVALVFQSVLFMSGLSEQFNLESKINYYAPFFEIMHFPYDIPY